MKIEIKNLIFKNMIASRLAFLCYILLVISETNAFALDIMGTSNAQLNQWQYSVSFDYLLSSTDLQLADGTLRKQTSSYYGNADPRIFDGSLSQEDVTVKDFETKKMSSTLSYGITRNFDIFIRLGASKADYSDSPSGESISSSSQEEPYFGGGLKWTFHNNYNFRMGCLIQANWSNSSSKLVVPGLYSSEYVNIDIKEVQAALGGQYFWTNNISFYGGPFYRYITGEFSSENVNTFPYLDDVFIQTNKYDWDIKGSSDFGGYFGSCIELSKNLSLNLEYQLTGDADAMGANIVWKF